MNQDNQRLHDTAATPALKGNWLAPDDIARSPLRDWDYGGIAIQDPSQGMRYQLWRADWDSTDHTLRLTALRTAVTVDLLEVEDVSEVTFTFDQNMRWSAAVRAAGTTNLHWYDASVGSYVVTEIPGARSPRLALDDNRPEQINMGSSDMVLTYMRGTTLCWRIQRDRFLQEYTHPTPFAMSTIIRRFGMSDKLRLQWELDTL